VTGESAAAWPQENHASLAAEHDMLAVLPATAHMLSVTATGGVPNMLAATITAADFPVAFFPVMTGEMWQKPAVQRNVHQIRQDGHYVIDPPWGTRYDVGLGEFVKTPMPPIPPQFIEVVRNLLPGR
jgi:phosphopantothenoylcysteine decarboxylase